MSRRVAITGIGIRSPLGNGLREVFENALRGRSGVRAITKFDASAFPVRFAGEIQEAVEDRDPSVPNVARWCRDAAHDALAQACIPTDPEQPQAMDVVLGNSISALDCLDPSLLSGGRSSLAKVTMKDLSRLNPAYAAAYVAQAFGLDGEIVNLTTACSSSASAIGYAVRLIRHGESECVVTGGADEGVSPLFLGAFANGQCLSTRNEDPQRASRPFCRTRDGSVQADGACILVLEERSRAMRRGAEVLAEIGGYGSAGDSRNAMKFPTEVEPGVRAIETALRRAGVAPEEIGYHCALGVAHPWIDVWETRVIRTVFREHARRLPVSSVRSMMGHPMGASGAIQTAIGAMALRRQAIPPTINYEEPDPECDLDYVPNEARAHRFSKSLIYTLGTGGNHSALVLLAS